MNQIISDIGHIPGVGGALLIDDEGLPVAAALRAGCDEEALAAHAAAALEAARALATTAEQTPPSWLHIDGKDGSLLIIATNNGHLVVAIDRDASAAIIAIEVAQKARQLTELMQI